MSGEVNGNLFLIKKGAAPGTTIAGQGEFTLNIGGEPIPLTNKSSGNWQNFLTGSTTTKSTNFVGTMTFSDDATAAAVLADADTATPDTYVIDLGGEVNWEGTFIPKVTAYNSPLNDAVTVAVEFLSSGTIVRTVVP